MANVANHGVIIKKGTLQWGFILVHDSFLIQLNIANVTNNKHKFLQFTCIFGPLKQRSSYDWLKRHEIFFWKKKRVKIYSQKGEPIFGWYR
jgi:choline-glycine betaine transporter